MGYSTTFKGTIELSRALSRQEHNELDQLARDIHSDTVMPSIHCDFAPNAAGTGIVWTGKEKTYAAVEWLQDICDEYLKPWGIVANGQLLALGARPGDIWILNVGENHAERLEAMVVVADEEKDGWPCQSL